MKTMKKLLCVVLSLAMIFGVFSIAASAVTGAENEAKINVKYEIEQVSGTPLYTAVDNNVYKLTVYAKAKYGLSFFQVPIHFDKTKFAIIMADDADIIGNMMYSYDGNHADIGDDKVYLYDEATIFSDTAMYTSAGASTTVLRSASYVGLGNTNAAVLNHEVTLVDTSNTLIHDNWLGSLPSTTGIAFLFLNNVGTTANKMAHFNAYNGQLVNDWVSMGSIYFIRLPGVSEEDAIGSVFGAYADDAYGFQGIWNTAGTASYLTASYVGVEPGYNVVSNAVVEAAATPSPVYAKTSQIRFNGTETSGTGSAIFDVRTRAAMSAADFATICGDDAAAKTAITDIGFVYADSSIAFDMEAAKTAVTNKATTAGYVYAPVEHIQRTGTEYVWTCLITSADYAAAVNAVGYITVGGTTYFFDANSTTDFSDLYDACYGRYVASLG